MSETFDLVVVGTGEGGSAAASKCRAAGWRVAVVDDQPYGGTCALRGCDPKKVLVGAADAVDLARRLTGHGLTGDVQIDWHALMQFKRSFTDPVPGRREAAFTKAGIATYRGTARFTAEDRMVIAATTPGPEGAATGDVELRATHFLIASGAEPRPLGMPGAAHVRSSTDFLDLEPLPARIAFIGAGYISFEFAHIAQRAGAQTVVLGRGAPLAQFEQDLVDRLVAYSRQLGIDVRTDSEVVAVDALAQGYRVHVRTTGAEPEMTTPDADLVVHGAGRIPRTGQLDLERANIAADEQGAIRVNAFLQSTTNPRVYAAGDCTRPPGSLPLTPVAAHEGLVAASNLLRGNTKQPDYRGVPSVVFTMPPLAAAGLTEAEAHQQGLHVRVKCEDTADWFSNRRVQQPAAMFKTLVDEGSGRIVGAHLLGPDAPDVINVFALAIRHGLTAADLKHMMYAYPTSTSDVSYML